MKSQILILSVIMSILSFCGCAQSKKETVKAKNECYETKLEKLVQEPIYAKVMKEFQDTFGIMKNDIRIFGKADLVTTEIDSAVFFNKDKNECLLIVLMKNNFGLVFGNARIIRGFENNGNWMFKPSLEYIYYMDYNEIYKENSFSNLSILARYSVLTDGDVKARGCDIDEHYWFVELKR